MRFALRCCALALLVAFTAGCQPSNATPGQWLRGNATDSWPRDWTFSDGYDEIFIEVATPYRIPHSVTIWCAQVDGKLYIGAREPDTKNWPGWLDKNRDHRLKIGDNIYAAQAVDITDEATLNAVRAAYRNKYELPEPDAGNPVTMRYWAIVPRT